MELIPFKIRPQPDDASCGPACLSSVYHYFGDTIDLETLAREVPRNHDGGTLAVHLANHALARGYKARIVTWNIRVFDPSWFQSAATPISERLQRQAEVKQDRKLRDACMGYVRFLALGGEIEFRDLESSLIRTPLQRGLPLITGLSATFLYGAKRERPTDQEPDDIHGEPVGHFVVLTGYVPITREVHVSDPLLSNPSAKNQYTVNMNRVLGAVYLGTLTHDGNLLILEPPGWKGRS
jgi:hypothetical protein